jgi:hypothetical protein
MDLDAKVTELSDTIRRVLELNDHAPITPLRLRQALGKTRSAYEFTNKAERILDQWKSLFAAYTELALEEGYVPVEKRFPDLYTDYITAIDANKKAKPLAEAYYIFKRLLEGEDGQELADALTLAAEKIRILDDVPPATATKTADDTPSRSAETPRESAQGP